MPGYYTAPGSGSGGSGAVVARAGDVGFEWLNNYAGTSGGVTLQKIGSFVMCSGYADYVGAFVGGAEVFKVPTDWADPMGITAFAGLAADGATELSVYINGATPRCLVANATGSQPADSSIQINAFWQTFDPYA